MCRLSTRHDTLLSFHIVGADRSRRAQSRCSRNAPQGLAAQGSLPIRDRGGRCRGARTPVPGSCCPLAPIRGSSNITFPTLRHERPLGRDHTAEAQVPPAARRRSQAGRTSEPWGHSARSVRRRRSPSGLGPSPAPKLVACAGAEALPGPGGSAQ